MEIKGFIALAPGVNVIRLFMAVIYNVHDKLGRLSLQAFLASLMFVVKSTSLL